MRKNGNQVPPAGPGHRRYSTYSTTSARNPTFPQISRTRFFSISLYHSGTTIFSIPIAFEAANAWSYPLAFGRRPVFPRAVRFCPHVLQCSHSQCSVFSTILLRHVHSLLPKATSLLRSESKVVAFPFFDRHASNSPLAIPTVKGHSEQRPHLRDGRRSHPG